MNPQHWGLQVICYFPSNLYIRNSNAEKASNAIPPANVVGIGLLPPQFCVTRLFRVTLPYIKF